MKFEDSTSNDTFLLLPVNQRLPIFILLHILNFIRFAIYGLSLALVDRFGLFAILRHPESKVCEEAEASGLKYEENRVLLAFVDGGVRRYSGEDWCWRMVFLRLLMFDQALQASAYKSSSDTDTPALVRLASAEDQPPSITFVTAKIKISGSPRSQSLHQIPPQT